MSSENISKAFPLGVFFIIALLFSWQLGNLTVTALPFSFLLLGGVLISLIVMVNIDLAMIILIFSMLLSPEIPFMEVPKREVVVRFDDVLLLFAFFAWLAKTAVNKELGFLRRTPLNFPIILYLLACLVSTLIGIAGGRVDPAQAFFYVLKYAEYPMIFFMAVNILRDERQFRKFLLFVFITYAIVSLNSYFQIGRLNRTTAPFEGEIGEPNTLSGYLVFIMAVLSGLFLTAKLNRQRWIYGGLFCLGVAPFLFTLSRSGYMAMVITFITLGVLNRRRKGIVVMVLLAGSLLLPFVLPGPVSNRVKETFAGPDYEFLGRSYRLEPSASARIDGWRVVFERWPNHPVFGYGVSGFPLIDAQYVTTLAETGALGFLAFTLMLAVIFRASLAVYQKAGDNNFVEGLTLGYLSGYVGLLSHALTANTFVIVRIMEPFWFVTALVMMSPAIFKLDISWQPATS